MKFLKPAGFTLIELLVALVVSGLLMASLVGISSAVQKSFSRSKDVSELQANLRFAMKLLVEDFGRVAFMYSPDPSQDTHTGCGVIAQALPALQFVPGPPLMFTLMGNYVSSRDYLLNLNQNNIVCRNQMDTALFPTCSFTGVADEPYLLPFGDGPSFNRVFCQNAVVRVEVGSRNYCYSLVAQPNVANLSITLNPPINRNEVKGDYHWINPVSTVTYTIGKDPKYVNFYAGNANYNGRWMLNRATVNCQGTPNADIADFLLPPDDQQIPGLGIDFINDSNGRIGGTPWSPSIQPACAFIPAGAATCPLNPAINRAVVITLRARTETEDPDFTIANYDTDPTARNIGIDLDNNSADGLAHVRTERTVVELRNLGVNQSL